MAVTEADFGKIPNRLAKKSVGDKQNDSAKGSAQTAGIISRRRTK